MTEVNMRQNLYSQKKTSHTSPSRVSYGVSLVRIWVKIDRVITAPPCIYDAEWVIVVHLDMPGHQQSRDTSSANTERSILESPIHLARIYLRESEVMSVKG